jgi:hypothetical protein
MCSPAQRRCDGRVPEGSVKKWVRFREPSRGTSRAAITLAVLASAHDLGATKWIGNRQSRITVEQNNSKPSDNRETIMSSSDGPAQRPVVPARQARQGVTGHNVRYVLGFSIAAVIIVFGIIWLIYFA